MRLKVKIKAAEGQNAGFTRASICDSESKIQAARRSKNAGFTMLLWYALEISNPPEMYKVDGSWHSK
jgi:hypothetical protein